MLKTTGKKGIGKEGCNQTDRKSRTERRLEAPAPRQLPICLKYDPKYLPAIYKPNIIEEWYLKHCLERHLDSPLFSAAINCCRKNRGFFLRNNALSCISDTKKILICIHGAFHDTGHLPWQFCYSVFLTELQKHKPVLQVP